MKKTAKLKDGTITLDGKDIVVQWVKDGTGRKLKGDEGTFKWTMLSEVQAEFSFKETVDHFKDVAPLL